MTADETPGKQTILLVDDEDGLRGLSKRVLERAGYVVVECSSADEAVAAANSHDGPIDLLLSDLIMPRTNGWQLAERLMQTRPAMRVLFMSGYPGHEGIANASPGRTLADTPCLQKPFTPDDLVRAVRQALAPRRPAAP